MTPLLPFSEIHSRTAQSRTVGSLLSATSSSLYFLAEDVIQPLSSGGLALDGRAGNRWLTIDQVPAALHPCHQAVPSHFAAKFVERRAVDAHPKQLQLGVTIHALLDRE